MIRNKSLVAGLVTASFAVMSLPAFAEVYVRVDPPAPRVETYEARPGHVWVPGFWNWRNNKHEWKAGHYVVERKGYNYQRDRWVRHDNNQWTLQRGGWGRDSDGDGVPDRNDRYPNNPRKQ